MPDANPRVLVVGAGPAGLTCASHLAKMDVAVDLAEQGQAVGGAVRQYEHAEIWVPIPGLTANSLVAGFRQEARQARLTLLLGRRVTSIQVREDCILADDQPYAAVVLATGAPPRGLEHAGEGVIVAPGRALESVDVRGLRVAVCGGGDNAFENAARMRREGAACVDVFSRGDLRARPQLIREALDLGARIAVGPYRIEGRRIVRAQDPRNDDQFDIVAVLWGFAPRLPKIEAPGLTAGAPLKGRHPLPRLWVSGDALPDEERSILAAMGDGSRVAKAVEAFLHSDQCWTEKALSLGAVDA